MNQLQQIRLEKHKAYLRETWLPEFFEKYKPLFDEKRKAKRRIIHFIKKYGLPEVINPDNLEHIPGIYRIRLKLTDDQLVPPKELDDKNPSDNDDSDVSNNIEDADLDQVLKESLNEYNEQLDKVLSESIKDNNDVDYEEYILNQAIAESLNNSNDLSSTPNQDAPKKEIWGTLYYVIDIRDYIDHLDEPIYVYGDLYYFSDDQKNHIKKIWNKINDLKYQQDFEYYKVLSQDIVNL
jgi:hypothetical protein